MLTRADRPWFSDRVRDEQSLPPLDKIMLTAVRSLVAKRPCFHDTGHLARELRELTDAKDDDFDLDKEVLVKDIPPRMLMCASTTMKAHLPLSEEAFNDAVRRFVVDGWLVPHRTGYLYRNTMPEPKPDPTPDAPQAA